MDGTFGVSFETDTLFYTLFLLALKSYLQASNFKTPVIGDLEGSGSIFEGYFCSCKSVSFLTGLNESDDWRIILNR